MSVCERLYKVQLQLKKIKTDYLRKIDEAQKLREQYMDQTKDLMVTLYATSLCMWTVMHSKPDPSLREVLKQEFHATVPNSAAAIARLVRTVRSSPAALFAKLQKDGAKLPDAFMLILAMFNFCFFEESTETFPEFVAKCDTDLKGAVCECLLVNPLVYAYFKSALIAAFDQASTKTEVELKDLMLQGLKEYAPMLPVVVRVVVKDAQDPASMFWNSFLHKVLKSFFLFGIAPIEFMLFNWQKLQAAVTLLRGFFGSDAGKAFVLDLIDEQKHPVICKEPSERLLLSVAPAFRSISCLNADFIADFTPDDINVGKGLFFVPISCAEVKRTSTSTSVESSTVGLVRRFLMDADLLKLPEERAETIEYFEQLASLSNVFGDVDLEVQLDKLADSLIEHPISIKEICAIFERRISTQSRDMTGDPLSEVAPYNSQFLYVKKLKDMMAEVQKEAVRWLDFQCLLSSFDQVSAIAGNEPPEDPSVFSKYVAKITPLVLKETSLEPEVDVMRSLCSIVLARTNVLDAFEAREDIKKMDTEIRTFIEKNRQKILSENANFDFLEPYKKDPSKLSLFNEEIQLACQSRLPFSCLNHIHKAYHILSTLLKMADIGEIGADQIVPFALTATSLANPERIWTTKTMMSELLSPLTAQHTPVEPASEYALIQFTSTCQYIQDIMNT